MYWGAIAHLWRVLPSHDWEGSTGGEPREDNQLRSRTMKTQLNKSCHMSTKKSTRAKRSRTCVVCKTSCLPTESVLYSWVPLAITTQDVLDLDLVFGIQIGQSRQENRAPARKKIEAQDLEVHHHRVCVSIDDNAVALVAVGLGVVLLHN